MSIASVVASLLTSICYLLTIYLVHFRVNKDVLAGRVLCYLLSQLSLLAVALLIVACVALTSLVHHHR